MTTSSSSLVFELLSQRCRLIFSSPYHFAPVKVSYLLPPSRLALCVATSITQGGKGGFKDTYPEEYLAAVLKEVYTRANLDPALIEDISVGNVCPPGGGANAARMAGFAAGIPYTTPLQTINRQCSSGLAAVHGIANAIRSGQIDIGIGE